MVSKLEYHVFEHMVTCKDFTGLYSPWKLLAIANTYVYVYMYTYVRVYIYIYVYIEL